MKNMLAQVLSCALLLSVPCALTCSKKVVTHEVVVKDGETLGAKACRVAGNVVETTKEVAVEVKDKTVELAHKTKDAVCHAAEKTKEAVDKVGLEVTKVVHRGQEACARGITEVSHAASHSKDKEVEFAHRASEAASEEGIKKHSL